MNAYISPLNYSIFIILYITCFIFIYTKYSEIVGLGALTVIQLAFTLFLGKEISQIVLNRPGGSSVLNLASMFALHGSLISMVLLTIALILTSFTIIDIQEKYNNSKGTPVVLPPNYQELFDNIKRNTIIIFVITAFVLIMYYFNTEHINVPIMPIISKFTFSSILNNVPAISTIILSITSLIISSYQVKHASKFSNLKNNTLIGR